MIRVRTFVLVGLLVVLGCGQAFAAPVTSLVYFTGIGCPHCARTDPVLLKQQIRQNEMLVVEYEIYRDSANAPLLLAYSDYFGDVVGVPALIAGPEPGQTIIGDRLILEHLAQLVAENRDNGVALPAFSLPFAEIDLVSVWGKPKIWFGDRIAIRTDIGSPESDSIKAFILDGTLPGGCEPCAETNVALSGDTVAFREAWSFNGWLLMRD